MRTIELYDAKYRIYIIDTEDTEYDKREESREGPLDTDNNSTNKIINELEDSNE